MTIALIAQPAHRTWCFDHGRHGDETQVTEATEATEATVDFSINLDKEVGYAMVQYSIMIIMPQLRKFSLVEWAFLEAFDFVGSSIVRRNPIWTGGVDI